MKRKLFICKNGRIVEIKLEDKNMKEGKGDYSSTSGGLQLGEKSAAAMPFPLSSPQFREWKYSPDIKNLKGYKKALVFKIIKDEVQ